MGPYQTLDKLEEKVYTVNSGDSDEAIQTQVALFIKELLARKRHDPFEEGLQASMIIYPDKAGFKVAESDGRAVHAHTEETLAQYLDGETMFSSQESMGRPFLKKDDPHSSFGQLSRYCISCRTLAGQDSIVFAFTSNSNETLSKFQLSIMEQVATVSKRAVELGLIKNIKYGVHMDDLKIEFDNNEELNPNRCIKKLSEIESTIKERKTLCREK